MSNDAQKDNVGGRFGLTPEEYNDLKTMFRMAGAIFLAVAVALIVVAFGSALVGSLIG